MAKGTKPVVTKAIASKAIATSAIKPQQDLPPVSIQLKNVGVRYRILTDQEATIKGRLIASFGSRSKRQTEFWALRGVNLEVTRGEVVGVIGSNGSGKSTLLRAMAGLFDPTEGSVQTQGEIQPLLDLIGPLNGELTGRQNTYLHGAVHRIPREELDQAIPKIIDFAELGAFFDVPAKTYSSGMMARLAFALATQLRPDIVLIDEILAVGDEHFQKKSYFRMKKLIEQGSLVVIVSHSLPTIQSLCTRAILLEGGRVIEDGVPEKVVEAYRRRVR
jgi:ABC-type polysaccharide/polyol phosphate transport system ATPase subunit